MKKTYVVQSESGGFWCGLNRWDQQLRKSQIFHSMKYAEDVVKRFKQYNPKIVEVSLTIVPEVKTNADRIRSMTDEKLVCFLDKQTSRCLTCEDEEGCNPDCPIYKGDRNYCSPRDIMDWLKQPYEEDD